MKRYLLLPLLIVLALLMAGVTWALYTESGMRTVLARVLPLTPIDVRVGAVEGRLAGPFTLYDVRVEWPTGRVQAERLHAQWNPWRLWREEVWADVLEADAPRVEIFAAEPPAETTEPRARDWTEFSLPVAVRVARLRIERGELRIHGEPRVSDLSLAAWVRAEGRYLDVRALDAASDQGAVRGYALLSTTRNRTWDVDLQWRLEMLEAGPVSGHTRITGRLRELDWRQSVDGVVQASIEARVFDLLEAPRWDGRLALAALPEDGAPLGPTFAGAALDVTSRGRLHEMQLDGAIELPALLAGSTELAAEGGWADGVLALPWLRLERADGSRLEGQARLQPGANLALDASLEAQQLRWPLEDEAHVLLPHARIQVEGDADDYALGLQGRLALAFDAWAEADVELDGAWSGRTLRVERLELETTDTRAVVQGRGELVLGGDAGPVYRFALDGDVHWPQLPPAAVAVTGEGDVRHVALETLEVRALDGNVDGHGTVSWQDGAELRFDLAARDLDPGARWPEWPGRVHTELVLSARFGETRELHVSTAPLRGQLRGRELGGELNAELEGQELRLDDVRLALGRSTVAVSGRVGAELDLSLSLDSPDLADLHPDAGGSLQLEARARGAREAPELTVDFEGGGLSFQQYVLAGAELTAAIDVSEQRASRAHLELRGLGRADEVMLDSVEITGHGLLQSHEVDLSLHRDDAHLGLAFAGGLDEARNWDGRLEELTAELNGDTLWFLSSPARLTAGPERVVLELACTQGLFGGLCAEGEWHGDEQRWRGALALAALELEPLGQWLGLGLAPRGIISGRVQVDGGSEGFESLAGGLGLSAGSLALAERADDVLLAWRRSAISFAGDRDIATATINVDLGEDGRIGGTLGAGWNEPDPSLSGRLDAEIAQLGLIAEFFPDLASLQGRIGAALELSGSIADPEPRGELYWLDGSAELPLLGLRPQNIELRATVTPQEVRYTVQAMSGGGEVRSEGRFTVPPEAFAGEARITGRDILLADLPEAQVYASPDLTLRYELNRLDLTGEVSIPRALVSGLVDSGGIDTSPDEVIVGTEQIGDPAARLEVRYDVRVRLGGGVVVDVTGLRASLAGDLRTTMGPEGVATGSGEVRVVEGTFGAFGQSLTIEQGRLLFTGTPLDNPGLDIRAVRRIDDVVAGALVRGTLNEPEISIFSEPAMPRAEALSYLTVGKSLSDLDAGERDAVNSAANSLALAGGNLLAREIGGRLGLDEFAIVGDQADDAELVMGKYLGPRLFVSYGVGLFDAVNTFRVRYQISQRWALEAGSGEESWADLIFGVERD